MTEVTTVLCVPGTWVARSDLIAATLDAGWIFAGAVMMNLASRDAVQLEVHEGNDSAVSEAFRHAGRHWVASPAMRALEAHASVVYVIGKGGSAEASALMMDAATALLDSGGLGVKVESAGVAHSPEVWRELTENKDRLTAFHAFVVTVTGTDEIHTCGMHNLGLRDIRVTGGGSDAGRLASEFAYYLYAESPDVQAGHTFSLGPDEPRYTIEDDPGVHYGDNDLFTNPFGAWRLAPN